MDEKDFSLKGLNDPGQDKDSKKSFDEDSDISFGFPAEKHRRPIMEDLDDSIKSSAPEPEEIIEADTEEDAEDYSEPSADADEYSPLTDEGDSGEAPLESNEDLADDEETVSYEESQAEDDAPAEEVTDDEAPVYEEEAADSDIVLAPSSTNGVTDFSEHRPVKRRAPAKKKKKKKKGSRVNNSIFGALILVTVILTVSLVVAITGIKIGMEYLGVGKSEDDITFNIPENASADDICEMLINNNIIENRTLFKIAMKLQHSPTLFPGDVTLHPSMGYSAIIEELSQQRDIRKTVTITFQEGITLLEAANMLEEKSVCTAQEFLFEFNKKQGYSFESMIDDSADTFYKMEGFFFPDTYEFYVNDSGYNVTRTIKTNFASKFTDDMQKKMQEQKLTLSEVMTLASIVQWEANSAEDMPKVASVFLNRLADPDTFPKLQSDATGNYLKKVVNVVGDTASKERYSELYDTYICNGLPVGPVCNPGIDAINAVLEPDTTKYYYFCNNLKTGKSYFAETLEEHEKNLVKAGLA